MSLGKRKDKKIGKLTDWNSARDIRLHYLYKVFGGPITRDNVDEKIEEVKKYGHEDRVKINSWLMKEIRELDDKKQIDLYKKIISALAKERHRKGKPSPISDEPTRGSFMNEKERKYAKALKYKDPIIWEKYYRSDGITWKQYKIMKKKFLKEHTEDEWIAKHPI